MTKQTGQMEHTDGSRYRQTEQSSTDVPS